MTMTGHYNKISRPAQYYLFDRQLRTLAALALLRLLLILLYEGFEFR